MFVTVGSGVLSTNNSGTDVVLSRFPNEGQDLTSFGLTPSKIKSISLPNDLQEWPKTALNGCTALETISVYGNEVEDGRIELQSEQTLWNFGKLKSVAFPSTVIRLGNEEEGYRLPQQIEHVYLPKNLRSLGNRCLMLCKLKTLDFSRCRALTHTEFAAVDQNPELTSLDLSNCTSLHTLGPYFLFGLKALTSVIFPASLKQLGGACVRACPNLMTIIWKGERPTVVSDFLVDCPENLMELFIP